MPLTGSEAVLSAALRTEMLANPDTQALDNDALTAMCDAIAAAILPHIVANILAVAPPGGGPCVVT